jgi:hypothetical protein
MPAWGYCGPLAYARSYGAGDPRLNGRGYEGVLDRLAGARRYGAKPDAGEQRPYACGPLAHARGYQTIAVCCRLSPTRYSLLTTRYS